jgi:hypothetical protein
MRQSNGNVAVVMATVLVVILAPVLYVASIGPAVWLADRKMINTGEGSAAVLIYAPIQFASDKSETAEVAVTWYTSLFVSRPPVRAQPIYDDPIPQPVMVSPVQTIPPGTVPSTAASGS